MNAVANFDFEGNLQRVVIKDGEPWFVVVDVCRILGIKNSRDAIERLDDDEKGVGSTDTLGGEQVVQVVSEGGWNTIVLRSRAAVTPGTIAHRYRRWITGVVLPQIRKTGHYGEPRQPMRADIPDVDPDASLSARVGAVSVATRLYGKHAGRALWEQLGLPRLVSETIESAGEDDRAALERILEHRPDDRASIREWLADAMAGDIDAAEALLHHGVKAAPEAGGFYIGQSHPAIVGIFKGTAWADGSFKASLKRLGSHTAGRISFTGHRRFDRYQSRVIWLPATLLD